MNNPEKKQGLVRASSVELWNGRPMTASRMVALAFHKRHADVMRDIERLGASPAFKRDHFERSTYTSPGGKQLAQYRMTLTGFARLSATYEGQASEQITAAYREVFLEASYIRAGQPDTAQDGRTDA